MRYFPFNKRAHILLAVVMALGLILTISRLALAHSITPPYAGLPKIPSKPPPDSEKLLSLTYARVLTGNVPVYSDPLHVTTGVSPTRLINTGYVWVTLATTQTLRYSNQQWYEINENEFVQADFLDIYRPTAFHGVRISTPTTFAWMIFDAWTAANPGEFPDDNSRLLKRYEIVAIYETVQVEDRNWYRVGLNQWIEQGMVGIVSPKPRPAGVGEADKWIEVDLYEQTLAAYEGDRMVYATLISSGLPWWQTETGLFQIWIKVRKAKMSGRAGYPDYYFLEDVPWTMYFNGEFALHGAYWHDRFGIMHSHGCVNMTPIDAHWLFEWSTPSYKAEWTSASDENPGTWVWVHDISQAEEATIRPNIVSKSL